MEFPFKTFPWTRVPLNATDWSKPLRVNFGNEVIQTSTFKVGSDTFMFSEKRRIREDGSLWRSYAYSDVTKI